MAARKPILTRAPERPELDRLVREALADGVSEEQLREQRASFVYGNAPENAHVTKESARTSSRRVRLLEPA